jgi:hypothetical protein
MHLRRLRDPGAPNRRLLFRTAADRPTEPAGTPSTGWRFMIQRTRRAPRTAVDASELMAEPCPERPGIEVATAPYQVVRALPIRAPQRQLLRAGGRYRGSRDGQPGPRS